MSTPILSAPHHNAERNAMPITKYSVFLTIVLAGPCIVPINAADSDITVKPAGENQYELTLQTSTTINIFDAQLELTPTAKRTCGTKEAHFGHYGFDISQSLSGPRNKATTLTLTQTVRCGSESPLTIPQTTSAPDGWKPSASDQSQIETQTYQYYGAKDAGKYADAYAMFDNGMKEATHFDSWASNAQSQNTKAGHVLNRRVIKIAWYKDPPSAPEPGIYAAADFSGQFENDPIYCGYLAWHRGADGNYRIIREEENLIDKGTIGKMGQSDVKALAAKFGCSSG
jgi:hypothetical protein